MERVLTSFLTNEKAFNDVKAYGRILSLNKDVESYQDEIDSSASKIEEVLNECGAEENYLPLIINGKINDNENFIKFLASIPLSTREDILFYSKKIADRQNRIKQCRDTLDIIKESYPDALNIDLDRVREEEPIFKFIDEYLYKDLENEEEIKDEPISDLYVTKIEEAPKEILNPKDDVYLDEVYEEKVDPNTITNDNSFFGNEDDLAKSLSSDEIHDFDEGAPEVKDEEETHDLDNTILFKMEDGISLVDIAKEAYQDEEGWEAIYRANELVIGERLKEKGLDPNYDFAKDSNVLSGLELNIPVTFEKEEPEKEEEYAVFSKAA